MLSSPSSWRGLYQEPLTLLLALVFQGSDSPSPLTGPQEISSPKPPEHSFFLLTGEFEPSFVGLC